jgi:ABC-type metal ion transport system substrate-binding protein
LSILSLLVALVSVIAGVTIVTEWLKSKKNKITITVGKGDARQQLEVIIEEMKKKYEEKIRVVAK